MLKTSTILAKPLITITSVIWSFDRTTQKLQILLVKRANAPYQDQWALPETFMRSNESADEAALRLIREKIGLTLAYFHTEQLATFSNQKRTPDERALSLAYMTFLPEMPPLKAGYGALEARWFTFEPCLDQYQLNNGPYQFKTAANDSEFDYYDRLHLQTTTKHLAFDHEWILKIACDRIRNKLDYQPNILLVLGASFTLKDARTIYAPFLNLKITEIDNSNFKKTHQALFKEVGTVSRKQIGRPAKLFKLARIQI